MLKIFTSASMLVFLGGGAGAVARHELSDWSRRLFNLDSSWGVFIINVSGSLIIGLLTGLLTRYSGYWWKDSASLLLITGFLGGYTTFSTFSLDTIKLLESQHWMEALLYVLSSVILSILACGIGVFLTR